MHLSDLPLRERLAHIVTRYDREQAKRKHYNVYALAQYLARAEEVANEVENGKPLDVALAEGFNGALLTYIRKHA